MSASTGIGAARRRASRRGLHTHAHGYARRYLLRKGLRGMKGVVFLDHRDEKMVLVREGWRVLKLDDCGLENEDRFSFYDQVREWMFVCYMRARDCVHD
jgi:hypothetical protein